MFSCNRQPLVKAIAPFTVLLALAACGGEPTPSGAGGQLSSASQQHAAAPADAADQALRSAAEPFEAVTERAFAAPWDRLDVLIAEAEAAVQSAGGTLPSDAAAAIGRQMSALAAARTNQNRAGIALAAVETYRLLVEAQDPTTAAPPVAVSLLDYAGFRYDALAQTPNPDWQQMQRLTAFAREQWGQVAPTMQSRALPGLVDAALGDMAGAAERRDVKSARSAAAVELALVDVLEEQVASQSGSAGANK